MSRAHKRIQRLIADNNRNRATRVDIAILAELDSQITILEAKLKAAPKVPTDFGKTLTLEDCAEIMEVAIEHCETGVDGLDKIATRAEATVRSLASVTDSDATLVDRSISTAAVPE